MRRVLSAATFLLAMCGTASAQSVVFTDGFEWGSVCAWSGDIWFPDLDIDLFGDETEPGIGWDCPSPADMVENNLDCDDNDPDVNPMAVELCSDVDDPAGILLPMTGTFFPAVITDLHVGVRIRHTYIGDLTVGLQSPTGTAVLLHNHGGGGADDLMTVYDLETTPVNSLDVFNGEDPLGDFWTLFVIDNAIGDSGEVLEWVLWIAGP